VAHEAKYVWFNDGNSEWCYALVVLTHSDGKLNLLYKSPVAGWESADNIPQGEGGRTWHL